MSEFAGIFSTIQNSKPVSNFLPRLPVGTHTVVVKRYAPKRSEQAMGTIIEADFIIGATNAQGVKPGEARGWAWFPDQSGWGGAYEQGRAKDFIEKVAGCINPAELPTCQLQNGQVVPLNPKTGQPFVDGQGNIKLAHDVQTIGELLTSGFFRGLQLAVTVTPNLNRDGSPRLDKKGRPTFNAEWTKIPQALANITEMRAQLDKLEGAQPPAAAAAPAQAAHTQPVQQGGQVFQPPQQAVAQQAQQPVFPPAQSQTFQAPPSGPIATFQPAPGTPTPGPIGNIFSDLRK
jgi:hypothetical protein